MKRSLPSTLQTLLPATTLLCCNGMPWAVAPQFHITFPDGAPQGLPTSLDLGGDVSTNGWGAQLAINGVNIPLWLVSILVLIALFVRLADPTGAGSRRIQVALHGVALALIFGFIAVAASSPQVDVGFGAQFALLTVLLSTVLSFWPALGTEGSSDMLPSPQ